MKNAMPLVLSLMVGAAVPAAVGALFVQHDLRWGTAMAEAGRPLRHAQRMEVVARRLTPEEVAAAREAEPRAN